MIIIKLAALTCVFYLAIALIMEGIIFAVGSIKGSFGLYATRWGWLFIFAVAWFISFSLAWRIVSKNFLHRL